MPQRAFLQLAACGLAGAAVGVPMSRCGASSGGDGSTGAAARRRPADDGGQQVRVLLAYFSRTGENYCNGGRRDLRIGNTEVLADLIAERLNCAVHRIAATEAYSDDYDDTVARNVREQDDDARPGIANPLDSVDGYDTILLASPIWNLRPPMIMQTFATSYDFTGKTVHPVTTYAMSGLGTTPQDYAKSCRGARIGDGLAVRGEEVRSAGAAAVEAWLRRRASSTEAAPGCADGELVPLFSVVDRLPAATALRPGCRVSPRGPSGGRWRCRCGRLALEMAGRAA